MKIVYFDTVAGISGDMTLGAFLSAGLPIDELVAEIAKLNLQGVELQASRRMRSGIGAVKVDVVISADDKRHRHLRDIESLIDRSSLSARVKDDARKIFAEVARAEAHVHQTSVEKVHFHEVGALDSIVDIVGAAICCEKFGIERVYTSPVKLGSGGLVETQHGKMPVPAPATMEILKGYPTVLTDIPFELTTPTGAAIVKALSAGVLSSEQIRIEAIGYGSGERDIPQVPNMLRLMVGELLPGYEEDALVSIETNIDNMNAEIYPYVIERLLAAGAHDAYLIPVVMKKGRPGVLLSALVHRGLMDAVVEIFLRETSTLGVRIQPVDRRKVGRESVEVETPLGRMKAKSIRLDGEEILRPEYEECRRIALEKGIPLIDVYRITEGALKKNV